MKGYLLALCSVLLVTLAQLMLRWAMLQLPSLQAVLMQHPVNWLPLLILCGGLTAYACSMVSWFLALRHLPLSRAYPLLSISYVLVWLMAISLPLFAEPFHTGAMVGVMLVLAGLLCMCIKPQKTD
ncbi:MULTISPECIES: 4-amino-4-deoxy-L-arabinose-phosphoundecaprenol flippase subunit ArnF [Pantoea]|uniref:Probable 4-amino-4-deoxy-L-arabinose-phosphoundecaprenol flippase subunit ArnF n=1 Tax=Pantoea stewartii subsp. stewartii DC283 TaxID=660596 RepID=H3RK84_PANSE|nr:MULTISPECIES: 4-amino-4-deoxy-L-arabinose-phosphoundecaprenol flippase subunit ArnF [Pantoea]ARF52565.1 4-amino-4-deoxy-L-arabinose-phospho-UDP flippase [Pantoea stewartii subsp. stewartii DC283]EHT98125.1 polymyxin resistance protein [Pantoea stewartii subsp. stewartii DC283]KAB0549412.1 4-amino-4-deoxy-L-arabinose-phospho-UDP flippase [Pantoea stewartii subsp. stewartii]KGD80017.1 4-amino-4-deoxy-L-arabinose-phospho-UDP flippase [Pantoea stewartii subsp. indologenes]NRH24596.1 4-amino-4-d